MTDTTDMARVRISVVVPAYNEAGALGATLGSLQRQDFAGAYEIIVVDNASSDATTAVALAHGVRVVHEPVPSVCAARQAGVTAARGDIVVSTDADTTHPPGWLTRIDATFRAAPDLAAVGGPCRYVDPPRWAERLFGFGFRCVQRWYAWTGRVGYVTATNLAFRRAGFPGYDLALTQGGDEIDLLRRLRRCGRVTWDPDNVVTTSSRRIDQGLIRTLFVSYGYYYLLATVINRRTQRTVIGRAPAVRPSGGVDGSSLDAGLSRRP